MKEIYNFLQLREIFHLEFLRWLSRKIKPSYYALKGGVNLRFFFKSLRYSEDMDLDIQVVKVEILQDIVMKILSSSSFQNILKPFGIERIIPPDITKAKQTQTTQRFKIHLIASEGEDLFTKLEFSRRGFKGEILIEPVSSNILREYKLPPLLVPHYALSSAINQKIEALSTRAIVQARDIFDLYILSSQISPSQLKEIKISESQIKKVVENIFQIDFEQFRDVVVNYLLEEEQKVYNSKGLWDEIRLKTVSFIENLKNE